MGPVISAGKNSRLYKTLVYDEQLCTDASASVETHQVASPFTIDLTVAPGKDPAQVAARVDQASPGRHPSGGGGDRG